ncbi:unnamed protein product [Phaedon cochleariae]|uniref:TRASH domain-containing protein n=1 Tax=Phaedon cochleariae TaxID=80249 RepID=A0A9P0DPY5_PHACE|nr:unnamed protein product [Phaedon cochleariae]
MEELSTEKLHTVDQAGTDFPIDISLNTGKSGSEGLPETNEIETAEEANSIQCDPGVSDNSEAIVETGQFQNEAEASTTQSFEAISEPIVNSDLKKLIEVSGDDVIQANSLEEVVSKHVEDSVEETMDWDETAPESIAPTTSPLLEDIPEESPALVHNISDSQQGSVRIQDSEPSKELLVSEKNSDILHDRTKDIEESIAVSSEDCTNTVMEVQQEGEPANVDFTESLSEIPSDSFPEIEALVGKTVGDNAEANVEAELAQGDKVKEDKINEVGVQPENDELPELQEKSNKNSDGSDTAGDISEKCDENITVEGNIDKSDETSTSKDTLTTESLNEKHNKVDAPMDTTEPKNPDENCDLNKEKPKEMVSNVEKDKPSESARENTEFVQVNSDNEKESETDKEEESNTRRIMEHDPIASDAFENLNNDDREGADEELCIIPDTEREISQAEREAASSIPPLRDLTEASASSQTESISESNATGLFIGKPSVVFKYDKEDLQLCNVCKLRRKVLYNYTASEGDTKYLCSDSCLTTFKTSHAGKVVLNWEEGSLRVKDFSGVPVEPPSLSFIRKCASCKKVTNDIENNLTWEIMDFCNEFCLTKYQKEIGSHCSSCQNEVKSNSLGKYCVRFGNDIRQFCTSVCLEKYKKGLKVCSYCQQDMSGGPASFIARVGRQFKDFCSKLCMEKYDIMTNDRPPQVARGTTCSVCLAEKPITIEFEFDGSPNYFCNEPCFVAFSFVKNIQPGKCAMCRGHFPKSTLEEHTMYYDNVQHSFCSNSCENIYIIAHRKIVPCSWCKVKKYNFDMIRRYSKSGPMINMCSVNCLSLYRVSIETINTRPTCCNFCQKMSHPMYHLTMSDATIRNFCSYNCVMSFQNQFPKQPIAISSEDSAFPVPTGLPKKNKTYPGQDQSGTLTDVAQLPIISSVQSLASTNGNLAATPPPPLPPPTLTPINTRSTRSKTASTPQVLNSSPQVINSFSELPFQVQIKQHFIVRPAPMPDQRNVGTMCSTRKMNKSTMMKPIMVDQEVQTDEREEKKILIPVPVPIYVPTPMHMFSVPTPAPFPVPIAIPIPIFIPTTRNSAAGIMKEIKKIQVKIPTDPYEAELLMMAEMVAEEKKEDLTDSESDVDDTGGPEDSYSPEPVDTSNFGDDMLQMALKMATELDEPAVDLEGALTANTITGTAAQGGEPHSQQDETVDDPQPMHPHQMLDSRSPSVRGRKRGLRQPRGGAKRGRRMSHQQVDLPMMQHHQAQQAQPPPEPTEKPDANMCLKYTFGVNAWKQWVTTKNTELEKSSRRVKLFKTEILQLTSDELNYSLCLFVKEVRKPNGAEYAPDTIYYLCLGIQQYLFENGRIDNIFCDPYYEKFTDCLDEVAKKFSVLYNDSHYIVTRVEEEHLWESKQLGAHSPHVLLSTLMFFNTKHFNLTCVDEHMQLSFSHIMKHWKRNPNQAGASKVLGSRNVLLRFYPPQSAIQNNSRKKKVYEQQENEENPLRCPVKLYEFYLSKCPESVKTRNDVFYLQPERSCVPDSPVWYSTMPLPKEALEKMLHRVKMVKEINVALLTS